MPDTYQGRRGREGEGVNGESMPVGSCTFTQALIRTQMYRTLKIAKGFISR